MILADTIQTAFKERLNDKSSFGKCAGAIVNGRKWSMCYRVGFLSDTSASCLDDCTSIRAQFSVHIHPAFQQESASLGISPTRYDAVGTRLSRYSLISLATLSNKFILRIR